MKLYELDQRIEELARQMIDADTGEVHEDVLDKINELNLERDKKIENIGCLIKQYRAEASAIIDESKNLKYRADVKIATADRLMRWLGQILDGQKFETPKVAIGFRKSESVEVDNILDVPEEYIVCKVERKPDKKAIKALLKDGERIPGVHLETKLNTQIK